MDDIKKYYIMLYKTLHLLELKKTHSETTKDPRFNGIANAAHCHP